MKALKRTPLSQAIMGVLMLSLSPALLAAETDQADTKKKTDTKADAQVLPEVSVTDQSDKAEQSLAEKYKLPVTIEKVSRKKMDETINIYNTEDAIKYMPSILVRKRYIGDTNAPVQTRTASTSQSARTLIYADGILLSTLLDNSNGNTGSPRFNTVSPEEIERVEMMYGPFSAAYSGNSMGGVMNIVTKMPKKFEVYADAQSSWQDYSQYGHSSTYEAQKYSGGIGDRVNDLSFRFDYSHLDSYAQPIAYATQVTSGATGAAASGATLVNGAYMTSNSYGQPMAVLGETALYHTIQDNFKWKLAYDISPTLKASYVLGMWQNNQSGGVNSFLSNATSGLPVTSGNVKFAQMPTYGASASSGLKPSLAQQTTWSHGMNLHSETNGRFDWELTGSVVDLSEDISRAPSTSTSLNGTQTSLTGTNWHNIDAKGIWRPGELFGKHEVSFGFHHDLYELVNPVYATNQWTVDNHNALAAATNDGSTFSGGKTSTEGYWAQDSWDFYKDWNLAVGGRLENWNAYDGAISSWANSQFQTVNPSKRHQLNFSPKAKITWNTTERLKLGAAIGVAYRYPTVGEMFKTFLNTSTNQLNISNPNLKPEEALSKELSAEYFTQKGNYRLSFFQEEVKDAIFSQSTLASNGTINTVPGNMGKTDAYGVEFSGQESDVGINGLDLFGSATWTDARITENNSADAALAALRASSSASAVTSALATNPGNYNPSTGALMPRIPEWRASFGTSYRFWNDKFVASVNGRYADSSFGAINNSDINHKTYVGVGGYFVVDTKLSYKINKQFTLSGGIDNINNENYWIYHPFPQRTYMAQLKFNY